MEDLHWKFYEGIELKTFKSPNEEDKEKKEDGEGEKREEGEDIVEKEGEDIVEKEGEKIGGMVVDMESGERAALVSGHNMYTEEASGKLSEENNSEHDPPKLKDENILGQFHEDALRQVGVGSYQWLVCFTAGFCLMSDGAQMFVTAFLVPGIQVEMCLEESEVPWLGAVTLIGLIVGALLCPLADHVGRRTLLIFAIVLHLLFNISASFTPSFGVFMAGRFGSAVGLGVCYPIACILFAEFLPYASRSRMCLLLLFWLLGGAYVLMLSYLLLPATGRLVLFESKEHHNSWHRVLLLSSVPSVLALASLICVSETARYLLYAGRDVNAIMVYQNMYKWNASRSAQYQLTELELPSKPVCTKQPPVKSVWGQMCNSVHAFCDSVKQIGQRQNIITTILLSLVWASIGFSYYGLGVWVEGRIQWLKNEEYNSNVQIINNELELGQEYKYEMSNRKYVNTNFTESLFHFINFSHVVFENCHFSFCEFTNVHSSKTYFIDSTIENSRFMDTDLTSDRFVNCTMINNTMLSVEPICTMDLDYNINQFDLIKENGYRLIFPFIAIIVNVLLFRNVKKLTIGVTSMLTCSLIALSSWFLHTEFNLLIFDAVWSAVIILAFNAVNIITTESYPVHLRATGFGLAFVWFRVFGLYGTLCLGLHLGNVTLPGIVVVTSLLVGGVALFTVPSTVANLM